MKWLVEFAGQESRNEDPTPWLTRTFGPQKAFVLDRAKRKCALCTRRAGKSEADATGLVDAIVRHPEAIVPYITGTSKNSRNILWNVLLRMNSEYGLGLRPDSQAGMFWTPKGGAIWLAGCKDRSEAAEKFRGPKYPRAIIDEAGTFRTEVLRYLIDDVLDPALSDYDGDLWLTGTPGTLESGYFWGRTTGKDPEMLPWTTHRWSVADNPYHPLSKPGALEQKRLELGFKVDDPTWRREYCGEWATDLSRLIYAYDAEKNGWDGNLPTGRQFRVLSVDVGFTGATAFTVGTSIQGFSDVYLEESYGFTQMLTSDIAAEVYRIKQRYPQINDYVFDHGGLGVAYIEELNDIYSLPFRKASKTNKAGSIRQVQDRLRMGKLKLHPRRCAQLLTEWQTLPWNEDHDGHEEGYEDHCSDSVLYNVRQHPMLDVWKEETPERGSPEWAKVEMEAMRKRALRRSKHSR